MTSNLFENIPAQLPEELIEILGSNPNVRIERIVSRGHASPEGFWCDQEQDEFVLLVQGGAGIKFEGSDDVIALKPGDHLTIGAHVKHRVEWSNANCDTIWLAVHFKS